MPRIFINLEAGCLQVNLMSTSAHINQLKYTILYYTILYYTILILARVYSALPVYLSPHAYRPILAYWLTACL